MERYLEVIRELREDHHFTQKQIAEKLGTTQQVYSRYETGVNAIPVHHILKLCDIYHVSADYLLGRTNRK